MWKENMDIDIVVLWVDGSDPEWQAERSKYAKKTEDSDVVRFRDWKLMRYWFRSVEKNMPWVRKIHFVTCGHYPSWLDLNHPKLHFVKHSDFIPSQYLPTFNANTIELNLHRIEGISERFVYFNDDMLALDCVKPEDVFFGGLPCGSAVVSPLIAMTPGWKFGHILLNDISFVNTHFRMKEVVKGNSDKWFSPKYGRFLLKNVYNMLFRNYFLGFEVFHEPSSMLKSTYEAVWNMSPDLLDKTSGHKFRDLEDVNQYIMTYYHFCTNHFAPRSPKCVGYFDLDNQNQKLIDAINKRKYKFIVLNDSEKVTDFQKAQSRLAAVLEEVFPEKSSFEAY